MEQNTYATVTTYEFPFNPHFISNNDHSYAKIRVIEKHDTVWFSVEDVCKATNTIPQHILRDIDPADTASFITYDGQEKIETKTDMVSFERLQTVFSKSGRPRAVAFLKWVEEEILGIGNPDPDNETTIYHIDQWRTEYLYSKPENQMTFTFKNSHSHDIRTIIREDGSVWFVAKDVCDVLDIVWKGSGTMGPLDDDEKDTCFFNTPGGNQKLSIISESGLYALVFKSRKPEAKKFRKWVTSEVLPQIRRTGAYMPEHPETYEQCQEEIIHTQDIPYIDPASSPGLATPYPRVSPKAATAFIQAATDTFWEIEKAMNEYKAMETSLKKAKKDVAVIIRSAKKVFPDMAESIDMLGGQSVYLDSKLEVEMR